MNESRTFTFYDSMARSYGKEKAWVVSMVRKLKLPKRKIYGCMAVESQPFKDAMKQIGIEPIPVRPFGGEQSAQRGLPN